MLFGGGILGFGGGEGGGGAEILSVNYTDGSVSGSNTTAYTFSSQSIGAAPGAGERRFVYVVAVFYDSASDTFNGVTIGGVSATEEISGEYYNAGYTVAAGIWSREVTSGTTANIVVNVTSGGSCAGIAVYSVITNDAGCSTYDTDYRQWSIYSNYATLNVPANGAVIVGNCGYSPTDPVTSTWYGGIGCTEDVDAAMENYKSISAASALYPTAGSSRTQTVDFPNTTDDNVVVGIALKPGA